jgi:hypothetical protein
LLQRIAQSVTGRVLRIRFPGFSLRCALVICILAILAIFIVTPSMPLALLATRPSGPECSLLRLTHFSIQSLHRISQSLKPGLRVDHQAHLFFHTPRHAIDLSLRLR